MGRSVQIVAGCVQLIKKSAVILRTSWIFCTGLVKINRLNPENITRLNGINRLCVHSLILSQIYKTFLICRNFSIKNYCNICYNLQKSLKKFPYTADKEIIIMFFNIYERGQHGRYLYPPHFKCKSFKN